MFGKKKNAQPNPLIAERDALSMEVSQWWDKIDAQVGVVLAQHQMTFLFPCGCPDDQATRKNLEKEQTRLRNMVAEYDYALANYRNFAKEHPEIRCAQWLDSHATIRGMVKRKTINK